MMKIFTYFIAFFCVTLPLFAQENYVENTDNLNMQMVWVNGGEFMMGCTDEQEGCSDDEMNVRKIRLDGFYIGMMEITQHQWNLIMGTTIDQQRTKAGKDKVLAGKGNDCPMYFVSWNEAKEFCRILSEKTGKTYMLPTEAQWEYAARGGQKRAMQKGMFACVDSIDASAWYKNNSGNKAHIVGTKNANALGLYDMTGNVWEWCNDCYEDVYRNYDTENPKGPRSSSEGKYVNRGGSWDDNGRYCRVSMRYGSKPTLRTNWLGFRVVMIP